MLSLGSLDEAQRNPGKRTPDAIRATLLVLPADHEFWDTHYPPNGWGCKCRVVGVRSPAQAKRLGGDPDQQLPDGWDARDGKGRLPGVDEGWDYQPGASALDTIQALTPKLDKLPAQPSIGVIQDWLRTESFSKWFENPRGNWPLVRLPDTDMKEIGARTHIAHLSPDTVAKQKIEHPEITPREYTAAQEVIDSATNQAIEQRSIIYVREEVTEEAGGQVLVVKATRTGRGLFVTSYRRLSRERAARETEIGRLLRKGERK